MDGSFIGRIRDKDEYNTKCFSFPSIPTDKKTAPKMGETRKRIEVTYPFEERTDTELKDDFTKPLPKQPQSIWIRMIHSFKRADHGAVVPGGLDPEVGVPQAGDTSQLHRKLKGRHLQMIAIGGSIGAGLFIGSGKALATGGPGAVVLDFAIIGIMLFCTINALGELATLFPVQGTGHTRHRILIQVPLQFSRLGLLILPGVLRWDGITQWDG